MRATGAQKCEEYEQLQRPDELAGGDELALAPRFLDPALSRLLGLRLVCHGRSYSQEPPRRGPSGPAHFPQNARKQSRAPAQDQKSQKHFGGKGQRKQLKLCVDSTEEGQRDIHQDENRQNGESQTQPEGKKVGAQSDQEFGGGRAEDV